MSCGRQNNRDFFNEMAPQWDNIIEVWPEKIEHILDVACLAPGESVMDVGTGTGILLPYILKRIDEHGEIDAVDISEGMLKVAESKFGDAKNVNFLNLDVENDLISGAYDCIIMYCMYPHLENPIDTLKWLYKVNLKSNGRIVIAFPESKKSINGIHTHNDGSVHSNHLQDIGEFKNILESIGLPVDYTEDNDDYYILRIRKDE